MRSPSPASIIISGAISDPSSNGSKRGSSGYGPQNGEPVVLELPLDKIRRPLMRTRSNDPNKVQELMDRAFYRLAFKCLLMCLKLMELTMVSLVVIGMKLTSGSGSQQSVAKFDEEQKKLSGIIFVEWYWWCTSF